MSGRGGGDVRLCNERPTHIHIKCSQRMKRKEGIPLKNVNNIFKLTIHIWRPKPHNRE